MKSLERIGLLFEDLRGWNTLLKYKVVFGVLSCFGLIFHYLTFTRQYVVLLTEIYLLLMTGLCLIFDIKIGRKSTSIWLVSTFLTTFVIEMIGTKTGLIFGHYFYSELWLLQLNSTPLIIGLLWIFVVLSGVTIANLIINFLKSVEHFLWVNGVEISKKIVSVADTDSFSWIIVKSLISACTAVILDIFLEPVAIKLDYWQWRDNTVPLQNYIAWFVIAFVASLFLYLSTPKFKTRPLTSFSLYAYLLTILFYIFVLVFVR